MRKLETKSADGGAADTVRDVVRDEFKNLQSQLDTKTEELAKMHAEAKTKTAEEMKQHSEGLMGHINNQAEEIKKLTEKVEQAQEEMKNAYRSGADGLKAEETKSISEQIFEFEGFKAYKAGSSNGFRLDYKAAAAMTRLTSTGTLLQPERRAGIVEIPRQKLTVRSLIPAIPVGAGVSTIEYVKELPPQGGPAMVAELAQKPQTSFDFALESTNIRTIAHWADASKQLLDDAAGLQSFIENRMNFMLDFKEEGQMLTGDGTGENLEGLIPAATPYALPAGIVVGNVTQLIDKIRVAKLQVRLAQYPADSVVLNPVDWALIEILKNGQEEYLISAFTSGAEPRLWGLRVVESDSIPQGEFLVGAFSLAAEIRDREDNSIAVSDQHSDNFTKNKITIRNEKRTALLILRPASFVHGTT